MNSARAEGAHGTPRGPWARRLRFGALSGVMTIAVLASHVLVNVIGARVGARLDVTATGEHRLSARTRELLSGLNAPVRVVIAADRARVDARAWSRAREVLREMKRASPNLNDAFLDFSARDGREQFRALIQELVTRERTQLDAQTSAMRELLAGAEALAAACERRFAPALAGLRDAITGDSAVAAGNRQYFEQRSGVATLAAGQIRGAAAAAEESLRLTLEGVAVPRTDLALQTLRVVLEPLLDQLADLSRDLNRFGAAPQTVEGVRAACRALADDLTRERDAAAITFERVARLERPDVVRAVDAIRSANCVLLIGDAPPRGRLAALEFDALFPPGAFIEAARLGRADLGKRAEEVLTTGIGLLVEPNRPIVVLLHGEGEPLAARPQVFSVLRERLERRGMTLVEWATALDEQPPALGTIDPDGKRPVVYATLAPDSGEARRGQLPGLERAARLGAAIDDLARRGAAILLSIGPAIQPASKQPDPTVLILGQWGLSADSGRPLLRERLTPQGSLVETDHSVQIAAKTPAHAIARAVRGLPTVLTWPIALRRLEDQARDTQAWELLRLSDERDMWAEAQWRGLWETPRDVRAMIPEASRPVFNAGRDDRAGDWVVGMAAERTLPGGGVQRLVAIGSNTWFMDGVAGVKMEVDGRVVESAPGNHELFESAVLWLAAQERLMSQSPEARTVPLVGQLSSGGILAIRIGLLVLLPLGVLVLGIVFGVLRR